MTKSSSYRQLACHPSFGAKKFQHRSWAKERPSLLAQTAITNSEKTHHSIDAEHGVEEKATASTAADVNSPTDRAQLDERVQKLEPMANPPTQLFRVPTVHGSTVT